MKEITWGILIMVMSLGWAGVIFNQPLEIKIKHRRKRVLKVTVNKMQVLPA